MANKIIVCQTGSRHRYLIPQVLENNGMLFRLYTDSTKYSLFGRIACFLLKLGVNSRIISRLSKRDPRLPLKKIFTTDVFLLKNIAYSLVPFFKKKRAFLLYSAFQYRCINWGTKGADCIYSMYIENIEFLKYAKRKGLKIVVDIYETPTTFGELIKEIDSTPEYAQLSGLKKTYSIKHEIRERYVDEMLKIADYYTVPSKFVVKSLSIYKNFDVQKVILQPYASSVVPQTYSYKPIKHKLIYVGNDPVRKGLIYCAKAAKELKKIYPDMDFRVIGGHNDIFKNIPPFDELNFVGILNRKELLEEYCSAEAYVFPTLFEGFAGTIIEAATCGCPIITTENAGTDVDEFPAIYIKEKCVDDIVKAVIQIFEDKQLQMRLSKDVYKYSQKLTAQVYENSLVSHLRNV